jgi:hypothetical protein
MKKITITAGLLAACLTYTSTASAAFIEHTGYTTDTLSGLDWFDIDPTVGFSHRAVSIYIQDGERWGNQGWRFASGAEFVTMMENFTGVPAVEDVAGRVLSSRSSMIDILSLLGTTHSSGDVAVGLLSDFESPGMVYTASISSTLGSSYYTSMQRTQHQNVNYFSTGSFLVRQNGFTSPVPEPSSIALFAAGLGLLAFRRKKLS